MVDDPIVPKLLDQERYKSLELINQNKSSTRFLHKRTKPESVKIPQKLFNDIKELNTWRHRTNVNFSFNWKSSFKQSIHQAEDTIDEEDLWIIGKTHLKITFK